MCYKLACADLSVSIQRCCLLPAYHGSALQEAGAGAAQPDGQVALLLRAARDPLVDRRVR